MSIIEFSFYVHHNFLYEGNELILDSLISHHLHKNYSKYLTRTDEKFVEIELISSPGGKFDIHYGVHCSVSGKFRKGRGYKLPYIKHSGNS